MAESKEELKSLLMKVKEESENVGLKLNIQKTKSMASSLITSWQIDGETVETVTDFIFLGSKKAAHVGSAACGIFLDQGSNPCILHWQADSLPLSHQGSPCPLPLQVCLLKDSIILDEPSTYYTE